MAFLLDSLRTPTRRVVRRFALATLAANVVIVVTGSAVRLTGSGLGCPTWPRCTDDSFVARGELGLHGVIEFGNRTLTFAIAVVAIATWVVVLRTRPRRRSLLLAATALALSVPAQAVLGGVTVLTDLNPWVVAVHLLFSLAIISFAVVFVRRVDESDRPPRPTVAPPAVLLARLTYAVTWVVLAVGTVVAGSGPHAGDEEAPRNGLDPAVVSQIHADAVFVLLGLTVGTWLCLRASGAPERARRAAGWFLVVLLAQGLIGATQYALDLPILLVGLHVLGAAVVAATATWMMLGLRDRGHASTTEHATAVHVPAASDRVAAP